MFAESMLETSWKQRTRRGWTTFTSFVLEALVIGLLLLLPLLRTVGSPTVRRTVSTPISAGPPEPPSTPRPRTGNNSPAPSSPPIARFVEPGHISPTISMTSDDPAPQPPGAGDTIPGVGVPGTADGFPISMGRGNYILPPPPPSATISHVFRTSTILEGSLIRKVQPIYPPIAKTGRIQGPVVLFAVISKSGSIDNLRVVSGHPLLVRAAIDAVQQWQYRPYILNHEPIEVETQITVNFVLGN